MSTIGMKRNNNNNSKNQAEATEFAKSEFWVNVGISTKEGFVSLPMNIPLSSMKEAKGSSELSKRKNALLRKLLQLADQLEPGEAKTVNLSVQLFRIPEEKENEIDEDFDAALDSIA